MKLHESTISTILGFLVIVVVGLLVVNYFRNLDSGESFPTTATTENDSEGETYTVAAGDSLWTISEKVYGTGYNWVDIREANDIENPNDIKEGQKLIIPKIKDDVELAEAGSPSPSPTSTVEATPSPSATPKGEIASAETSENQQIKVNAGEKYTVVHGDNLWDIAVAAYGDGFRWVDIAEANHLANPRIIHAGNVLTIPA